MLLLSLTAQQRQTRARRFQRFDGMFSRPGAVGISPGERMAKILFAAIRMALHDQDSAGHQRPCSLHSGSVISTLPSAPASRLKPHDRASACMRAFPAKATPRNTASPRPLQ